MLLPSCSDEPCVRFETQQDKQRNKEDITDNFHSLFSLLHSWDEEVEMPGNETASYQRPVIAGSISLDLKVCSPSDEDSIMAKSDRSLHEDRYRRSVLQILTCDELLTMARICDFEGMDSFFRHIDCASLARVAAELPNLEQFCLGVYDDHKVYAAAALLWQDFGNIVKYKNPLALLIGHDTRDVAKA